MTKRDFFMLLIKVFGLYLLISTLFSAFPGTLLYLAGNLETLEKLWIIVSVVLLVSLFVALVFKAHKVVELLNLEKGFDDEKIELGNLKAIDLLRISILIIGGFIVIQNISPLLVELYNSLKYNTAEYNYSLFESHNSLALSIVNLIIGFSLIKNYNGLARLLSKNSEPNH